MTPTEIWSRSRLSALTVLLGIGLLASCSRKEEAPKPPPPAPQAQAPAPQAQAPAVVAFRVVSVDLGNSVGPDKRVLSPTTTFKPTDTIYASIVSEGAAPKVTLAARWTFEDGQLVSESSQSIAPTGPAVTEFHISKPDGWPAGKYKLEVLAEGKPAGMAQFAVN